jgi:hypothetical protein
MYLTQSLLHQVIQDFNQKKIDREELVYQPASKMDELKSAYEFTESALQSKEELRNKFDELELLCTIKRKGSKYDDSNLY